MNIVQVSFYRDPERRDPESLLDHWKPLPDGAAALAGEGLDVTVVLPAYRAERFQRDGVTYDFQRMPAALPGIRPARTAWIRGVHRVLRAVREARPDVIHVHGLIAPLHIYLLTRRSGNVPVLVQDHAGGPPRGMFRGVGRWGFSGVAALVFTAAEQAAPFVSAGVVSPELPVYEVLEASSNFSPGDREVARSQCGMSGDPALLWVGRLDTNKDPMTVLDGVERALEMLPALRMWCLYQSAPLLDAVRRRIETSQRLRHAVHLVGEVNSEDVESFCRAADLFVSGSRREGSGFALIEAVACGLPPVVSAIPSFIRITGGGRIGALYPAGDGEKMGEAIVRFWGEHATEGRTEVRRHFDRALAWPVIAGEWKRVYHRLSTAP